MRIIPDDDRTRSDYFQTPNTERLAELGMRFTQGYSPAASCCPTRRALQTGQVPARHIYSADRQGWLETYRKQLNLPRMLKASDDQCVTAHFGKWDHRYDEIAPTEQDFDVSDGYTGNGTGGSKGTGGPAAMPDPKRIDTITDKALHFIDESHACDKPFYLQVSHYAVHLDIFYNDETLADVKRNLSPGKKHNMPEFAAMTSDMDAGIGRVLDKLIELDLLDNTYLVCRIGWSHFLRPKLNRMNHEPDHQSACLPFCILHCSGSDGSASQYRLHSCRRSGVLRSWLLRSNGGPDAANGCAGRSGNSFHGLLRGGSGLQSLACSYATACIGKWHLEFDEPFLPRNQGFDHYFGLLHNLDPVEVVYFQDEGGVPLIRHDEVVKRPADPSELTERYTDEAIGFIEKNKDGPFFIICHTRCCTIRWA